MSILTGMRFLYAALRLFFKLAEGRLDPSLAFTTGKLKVEGNIDKALRLKQIIDSKKA